MRALWDIGAVAGVFCMLYVATHSQYWVSDDPPALRKSRIAVFIVLSGLSCVSISSDRWQPEIETLLMLYGVVILVGLNAVSLRIKASREKSGEERNGAATLDAG
jgi:hypothetical protein